MSQAVRELVRESQGEFVTVREGVDQIPCPSVDRLVGLSVGLSFCHYFKFHFKCSYRSTCSNWNNILRYYTLKIKFSAQGRSLNCPFWQMLQSLCFTSQVCLSFIYHKAPVAFITRDSMVGKILLEKWKKQCEKKIQSVQKFLLQACSKISFSPVLCLCSNIFFSPVLRRCVQIFGGVDQEICL